MQNPQRHDLAPLPLRLPEHTLLTDLQGEGYHFHSAENQPITTPLGDGGGGTVALGFKGTLTTIVRGKKSGTPPGGGGDPGPTHPAPGGVF